jgi:hypothetical protein
VTNHNLNRSLGIWRKWRLLPEHFQEKACAGRGIRAFTPVFAGIRAFTPVFAGIRAFTPVFAGIRAFTPVFAGYGVASGFRPKMRPRKNARAVSLSGWYETALG